MVINILLRVAQMCQRTREHSTSPPTYSSAEMRVFCHIFYSTSVLFSFGYILQQRNYSLCNSYNVRENLNIKLLLLEIECKLLRVVAVQASSSWRDTWNFTTVYCNESNTNRISTVR